MKRPDELAFMRSVLRECEVEKASGRLDRLAPAGMSLKRAYYLLGKWSDRDWINYGVSVCCGWLTYRGAREMREVLDGEE